MPGGHFKIFKKNNVEMTFKNRSGTVEIMPYVN